MNFGDETKASAENFDGAFSIKMNVAGRAL